MTRWIAGIVACFALVAVGCGSVAERNATRDDLRRFHEQRAVECLQIKRDLVRFIDDNALRARELPIDLAHFLSWYRREWWNLTEDVAVVMAYEREAVQKLADGAARCYGYDLRNFPVVTEDLARFFKNADPEYANLVKDVVAFIEVQHREILPLRQEVSEALAKVRWEAASLDLDLRDFLQWRDREWRKLASESKSLVLVDSQLGQTLRDDLRRFRAARAIEGTLLVADLKAYWHYEGEAMPPRLIDDLYRWGSLSTQEFSRLRVEVAQFGEGLNQDVVKLAADAARYGNAQLEQVPLLVIEVERFFSDGEVEFARLDAGMRRFWAANVALGTLSMRDMRQFFVDHTNEEAAELHASLRRFVSYAGKEWKDFRGAIARFCWDDSARGFGYRDVPSSGGTLPLSADDPRAYPVRGYDAGSE